ncbi:MAG: AAA family ATPase [Legionellales bacterium]|nr:AAA family ATPase [Legionellales bacterium]
MSSNSSVVSNELNTNKYYWQEFGLENEPFGINPNEIYKIAQWEDYSDLLAHLINHNNLLEVILGESGIGKTTFINFFNQKIILKASCVTIQVEPEWSVEKFISVINASLGFAQNEISNSSLKMINAHLPSDDIKYIIALDDADKLSEEILLIIKEWTNEFDINSRIRFILVADISFRDRLKLTYSALEYEQNLTVLELKSLNFQQTQSYIKHCLISSGLPEEEILLSYKDIKKIFRDSDGNFTIINDKARRMLIDKVVENGTSNSIIQNNKNIFFISAVVLVIISGFLFYNSQKLSSNKTFSSSEEQFLKLQKNTSVEDKALSENLIELDDIEKQQNVFLNIDDSAKNKKLSVDSEAKQDNQSIEENDLIGDFSIKTLDKEVVQENKNNEFSERKIKQSKQEDVNLNKHSNEKPPEDKLSLDIKKESKLTHDTKSIQKSIEPYIESSNVINERADLILQDSGSNYTIQLMAANSSVTAAKFITDNKLETEANYYLNNQQEKVWYAVIYGSYRTKEDARLAIAKMPFKLRKNNPWIRKISEIQNIVKLSSNASKNNPKI